MDDYFSDYFWSASESVAGSLNFNGESVPNEVRDELPAEQLSSRQSEPATPTQIAEYTNSQVVRSDTFHALADFESTRSIPHDLSESPDTDTGTDDQEGDGEILALNNVDSPYDLGPKHRDDSEQEESSLQALSSYNSSDRASHDSGGIGEAIADSGIFAQVLRVILIWQLEPNRSDRASVLRESGSITISDDLSHISKIEERQFLALRATKDRSPTPPIPWPPPPAEAEAFFPSITSDFRLREPSSAKVVMAEPDEVENIAGAAGGPSNANHGTSLKRRLSDSGLEVDDHILGLDLDELQNYISRLAKRATYLKMTSVSRSQSTHRHLTLYRIMSYNRVPESRRKRPDSDALGISPPFLDAPEWMGSVDTGTLHCKAPIQNFDLFMEKNKDISFIVFKTYTARHPEQDRIVLKTDEIPEITIKESIRPITRELIEAVKFVLGSQDKYADLWHDFKAKSELPAPYLFVFHQRGYPGTVSHTAKKSSREQLASLWTYVIHEHGNEYTTADISLSSGKITSGCIKYLFKPGDILVQRKADFCLGWVAKSWAKHVKTYRATREHARAMITKTSQIPLYGTEKASKGMVNERVWVQAWKIPVWNWDFDGSFERHHDELSFSVVTEDDPGPGPGIKYASRAGDKDSKSTPEPISIKDLEVFPIRYAPQEVVQQLRRRGKAFWQCRKRKLVCYEEHANDSQESMLEERYMVDMKAYRSLHKSNQWARGPNSELQDELGPEAMAKEEPPDDRFELLLPPTIKGFNMRRKKWFDLVAERITDVEWNEDAFKKVVMNSKAKDLIQALVSNQLASEASTDLIENKGNGLILLLHGSPGTGKTLTAEGVAEITKKPLYRVTCADIGTKPEDAEKYLESILHLGKLWRCVVLLDEADVFLEQRSLEDLKRNSLVSVFLRVLEYYEGILILTSNRVGTFDEAFKSRIQLALHYPALGPYERLRIWENFLERLEKLKDPSIDVPDLRDHLKELQVEEMNGRQIRNAITTARQYASWKNVTLTYTHLKDVIDVAGRFDRYLDQLHGGRTQDQLAEEEGVR